MIIHSGLLSKSTNAFIITMITKLIEEDQIKRFRRILEESEKIVITSHIAPDGDALGSSLGFARVLESLGKAVKVVTPDVPAKHLMFLPGAKEILPFTKYEDFCGKLFEMADLILVLDYNSLKRIDRVAPLVEKSKAVKVMVDHHEFPDDFCDLTISYPQVSSTSMLVFRLLSRLGLFPLIDKEAGTCLLTGMMTDTGNFAYNCQDPDLYIVESELIKKGVDKQMIYDKVFNEEPADSMLLNAFAISEKMQLFMKHGAALITLTRDELARYRYQKGYTESLVNRPLKIPQIKYSFYLREEPDFVKVSARSKGDFPVNEICAEHFGGGGHLNAAGGEFYGTMEQAIEKFKQLLPEFDKYIEKTNGNV